MLVRWNERPMPIRQIVPSDPDTSRRSLTRDSAVIVPPRSNAVPSETAETAPTPRDRRLQAIAEHGRMSWQEASGHNWRALVEADIGRWKRVIGHALRSQTDKRQAAEVAIAVDVLNRSWSWDARATFASHKVEWACDQCVHPADPCNKVAPIQFFQANGVARRSWRGPTPSAGRVRPEPRAPICRPPREPSSRW